MIPEIDPLRFGRLMWPDARLYGKQEEIVYSVEHNVETYVVAGNKLGKDFIAGYICPNLFLRALKTGRTCRIVTHSVAEHHLNVLWGEISRFLKTARFPLLAKDGGPLWVNHMDIRLERDKSVKVPLSYLVGRVSDKGEGLSGHHAEVTLFVADEASGVEDVSYVMAQGWAKRMLIFGNPNQCSNFFRKGVKSGDLLAS